MQQETPENPDVIPASQTPINQSSHSHQSLSHQLWKKNDIKAQKNGSHRTIYWVKKKPKQEDNTIHGEKWTQSTRYIGEWVSNAKQGYGIQFYENGDKYEGMWQVSMRYGNGTYWRMEKGKLRREYTGEWAGDKKSGKGAFFYKNGDRYDGFWAEDLPQGEGRMIYAATGDIYEGQWHGGKRNGYGALTKRNGDHYEGQWVNDKKEGQGSYYYREKGKMFVGEWVMDLPKAGVYTQVEDEEILAKIPKKKYFMDPYYQPDLPKMYLGDPSGVLEEAMESVKKSRASYRAQHIPIEAMFAEGELEELRKAFGEASQGSSKVDLLSLKSLLEGMEIYPPDQYIVKLIKNCMKTEEEVNEIDFETFVRVFALLLEESMNKIGDLDENKKKDVETPGLLKKLI